MVEGNGGKSMHIYSNTDKCMSTAYRMWRFVSLLIAEGGGGLKEIYKKEKRNE
jgi:hypothetical protein